MRLPMDAPSACDRICPRRSMPSLRPSRCPRQSHGLTCRACRVHTWTIHPRQMGLRRLILRGTRRRGPPSEKAVVSPWPVAPYPHRGSIQTMVTPPCRLEKRVLRQMSLGECRDTAPPLSEQWSVSGPGTYPTNYWIEQLGHRIGCTCCFLGFCGKEKSVILYSM